MKKKILIIVIALAVFGILLGIVVSGKAGGFDDSIRYAFYSIRCKGLTVLAERFSAIGSWWGMTIICLVLLILPATRITAGVPAVIIALATQVFEKIIKQIVGRERPPLSDRIMEATGYSFPSGHSTTSMAVFLVLIYVVRTQIKDQRLKNILTILLTVPMIFVGLSRIYAGVHYPTDVFAGWALGIAITTVCIMLFEEKNAKKELKTKGGKSL